jgi:DNA repair photolyase
MNDRYNNITFHNRRIFIDVGYGCTCGCKYCYVFKDKPIQELMSEEEFISSLIFIENNPNFIKGEKGTLISLSPNTEPFLSLKSSKYVKMVLDKFLKYGNPIQISTKSGIPDDILLQIQTNRKHKNQVIFFISVAVISSIKSLEPFAPNINIRNGNLLRLKAFDIPSCLYIKPAISQTIKDFELFLLLIQKYMPDYLCIGVFYEKQKEALTNRLIHPVHSDYSSNGIKNTDIIDFTEKIYLKFQKKLFYSSICVMAYANDMLPSSDIWRLTDNPLCVHCRPCHDNFKID